MKSIIEEAEQPQIEFFQPELRDGFFIPTMMKRFWAAQIKVLGEIDRICQIYNIKYFADCGTLLGAVRHGGYIPWDDDLDICMLRDDYIRFIEIAEKELPDGYIVINIHNDAEYDSFNCRVDNSANIENSDQRLKGFFGCPYIVGIDIFVLDGLSDNDEFENLRRSVLNDIAYAIEMIDKYSGTLDANVERLLKKIEETHHIKLDRSADVKKQLLLLTEKNYSLFPTQKTNRVAKMTKWVANNKRVFKKELFENIIRMPFEYIHIPVPAYYDEVLRIEYGNFMRINKRGGLHEYPLYKEQEDRLKKAIGCNPFRYTMPAEPLKSREKKSCAVNCNAILSMLTEAHEHVHKYMNNGDIENAAKLLNGCYTLSLSLISILMNGFRNDTVMEISQIQNYSNQLNNITGHDYVISQDDIDDLDKMLHSSVYEVNDYLDTLGEEILFVVCKASWWASLEEEYYKSVSDSRNSVYVMPISYQILDAIGERMQEHNDIDLFSKDLPLVSSSEYDIKKRHPDRIIIQFPYDGYNTILAIPEFFYSKNLRKYTKELIYVPCFDIDAPQTADDKVLYSIKMMVEQPAVYYADKVCVKTREIRMAYIDSLIEITGPESRFYWENKIINHDLADYARNDKRITPMEWNLNDSTKRIVLFQFNCNTIIRGGYSAIDKIKEVVSIFESHAQSITCIFSPHESLDQITAELLGDELFGAFLDLLSRIKSSDSIIYDEKHIANNSLKTVNAYYGDFGNMAYKCHANNIPVMIMTN